eukprot:jgi/Bigna1/139993/aug1.53_g14701
MRDPLFQRHDNLLQRPGFEQHQSPGVFQAAGVAEDARETRRKGRTLPEAEVTAIAIERATRVPWPNEGRKSQQMGDSYQGKGEGADIVEDITFIHTNSEIAQVSLRSSKVRN